jgi:CheY-like chemotaxis protein
MKPIALIIEDDSSYQMFLRFQVESLGYAVVQATDGMMGLKMASMHSPKLIVTDFSMPKMSAYDVWKALQGDAQLRHIPFVILSALVDGHWGHHQHNDLYILQEESLRKGSTVRLLAKGGPNDALPNLLRSFIGHLPIDIEASKSNSSVTMPFGTMGLESVRVANRI